MPGFIKPFQVKPGSKVRLPNDFDPAHGVGEAKASEAKALLAQGVELLAEYQARLAAQDTYGVLLVLQAMDAAGKESGSQGAEGSRPDEATEVEDGHGQEVSEPLVAWRIRP